MKSRLLPKSLLQPLDWNFSSCPPDQIPILFCYEFARENTTLVEMVDYMRNGQPQGPTYWSPIPTFGWREWPDYPFLSIPPAERARRIGQLFTPNPVADIVATHANQPLDASWWDLQLAIAKSIRAESTPTTKAPPRNRGATRAKYRDRLRMLSIYRLRQHYSDPEMLELLRNRYQKISHASPKNLNRTCETFRRHLCAFCAVAEHRIAQGRWFPPFGPHLVEP